MAVPKSKYKVYMYKNDYKAMCTEVYKHQDIQTGGNLFGLWTTSGSAVIHVVLGPGQDCRRTSTSFHQDLEYMARVDRFVSAKHQLCRIGEWRSHHSLILDKPSAEDEITIRRNFPRGSIFLVIIANIRNGDTVKLSPYFFTDGGERYEIAEYEVLDCDGPFSTDDKIVAEINFGAEGKEYQRRREITDHSTASDEDTPSERDIALKKIHDQLKHWYGIQSDSKFKFETSKDIPGAIEISFKHNRKYWMVRFPKDFPTKPAKLFYSTWESSVRSNECVASKIVKPLDNDVNVLLTIKNVCGECKICTNFTKDISLI